MGIWLAVEGGFSNTCSPKRSGEVRAVPVCMSMSYTEGISEYGDQCRSVPGVVVSNRPSHSAPPCFIAGVSGAAAAGEGAAEGRDRAAQCGHRRPAKAPNSHQ